MISFFVLYYIDQSLTDICNELKKLFRDLNIFLFYIISQLSLIPEHLSYAIPNFKLIMTFFR